MKALPIALLIAAALSPQVATAQTYLNSQTFGKNTYTSGTLYGQPYNSNTTRFGNNSMTSGSYGGRAFTGNNNTYGNTRYDNFNMGGRSVNCTTTTVGGYTTTNCW
jgi:hypothetical protein